MNRDEMIAQFAYLLPADRPHAILGACFKLTIVTREILASDRHDKFEYARSVSELYHRVFPLVAALLNQSDARYPDEVLIGMLHGFIAQFNLDSRFIREDVLVKWRSHQSRDYGDGVHN
jgi:hypothetical protein